MSKTFFNTINKAVKNQDGNTLASHLQDLASPAKQKWVMRMASQNSLDSACEQNINNEAWLDVVTNHLYSIVAMFNQSYVEACECVTTCLTAFTKIYKYEESPWASPVMEVLVIQTRKISQVGDKELEHQSKKTMYMEKAGLQITQLFSLCNNDKKDSVVNSKRYSVLFLVVNLFKLYFAMKTLRLCGTFIKQVEQDGSPALSEYPVSHTVTYKFYVGRIHMLDGEFKAADECFHEALSLCHKDSMNNKRMLLVYYVPVKLLLGKYPTKKLLEK